MVKILYIFFLKRIDTYNFNKIVIVCKISYFDFFKKLEYDFPLLKFIYAKAGKDRQSSSFNALKILKSFHPKKA